MKIFILDYKIHTYYKINNVIVLVGRLITTDFTFQIVNSIQLYTPEYIIQVLLFYFLLIIFLSNSQVILT